MTSNETVGCLMFVCVWCAQVHERSLHHLGSCYHGHQRTIVFPKVLLTSIRAMVQLRCH